MQNAGIYEPEPPQGEERAPVARTPGRWLVLAGPNVSARP